MNSSYRARATPTPRTSSRLPVTLQREGGERKGYLAQFNALRALVDRDRPIALDDVLCNVRGESLLQ